MNMLQFIRKKFCKIKGLKSFFVNMQISYINIEWHGELIICYFEHGFTLAERNLSLKKNPLCKHLMNYLEYFSLSIKVIRSSYFQAGPFIFYELTQCKWISSSFGRCPSALSSENGKCFTTFEGTEKWNSPGRHCVCFAILCVRSGV